MVKWNEISGTHNFYSVSSDGNVRSNDRTIIYSDGRVYFAKGRILKPSFMTAGYLKVTLCVGDEMLQKGVHIIVAETFIPNPYNLRCVCHKNDIKTDNRAANLFWGTHKDNTEDMIKKGRRVSGGRKLTDTQVLEIRKLLMNGVVQREIGVKYNICQTCISDINLNKSFKEVLA